MIRRHRRSQQEADLDITAFMNLMIVLVPILLINLIFSHTAIIELNFPSADQVQDIDAEQLSFQVLILPTAIELKEGANTLIKRIENTDQNLPNLSELSLAMQELKRRVPDKRDITLLAQPDSSYQTIINVMDAVRAYPTVISGNVVNAELFPDIGIADAPEVGGN
ncbi:biopolymer transporter ExbD [Oleiphilus sp. HI0125]|uniref:ExbD/TolR family protein n=1 Tax=Oleiphilus sp. HI0125 TaxID=1822266 RepID=UPI0007C2B7A4|nr:biopolymer transporter ExbD [Oleiphilus sp. HI0125]KZZ58235.1 biopolymer transporter ExbD [Oleiphilus sp. HI0125]KZZ58639.1 biopolymer transporter ExbD [Oleiphilus sp. HI0125]